ncbi:MAG: hypothetical protein Q7T68_06590 [Sphingopyxis sp.]|nr:hypothetical protein [Sphingopyxis sp.]
MKNYLFSFGGFPANLIQATTSTLAYQAEDHVYPQLSNEQTKKLIAEVEDLTPLNLIILEQQRRYYDASLVTRTPAGFYSWIQRCLLRFPDKAARREIAAQLGIENLNLLPSDLAALNLMDPILVTYLLEGRIAAAVRAVPRQGYGDDYSAADVLMFIATVSRLWIAHDLQLEAATAHVRIFRPTELPPLDGAPNGKAPLNSSLAVRISDELELFEKAARLYFGEQGKPVPRGCQASFARSSVTINTERANYAITWPSSEDVPLGRDASDAESKSFRDAGDLEERANTALVAWRAVHGDNLEAYVLQRMTQARTLLRQLRSEVSDIRCDKSLSRKPVYKSDTFDPLARLWLACERAVAWTGPIIDSENTIHEAPPEVLDLAIQAARSGQDVNLPEIKKHNVHRANRLFFVLRCMIARDPGHLPKALLTVVDATGETIVAGTREAAEAHRDEPFAFEEIHAHQQSRNGTGERRDPKEAYSHAYTKIGKVFAKEIARKPTAESDIIVAQAWGPIGWRLGMSSNG